MSDSPYKPPSYQAPDPARQPVRLVAKYQRWVIFALLGNIVTNVLAFAMVGQDLPVRLVVMVVSLAVAVFAMAAIFLLAKELFGTAVGVLCAILMIVPCISLIALLVVNQKATAYLRNNGVRVGFWGANPDSI
jgi:Mg2+/Co2+ transporter CorB